MERLQLHTNGGQIKSVGVMLCLGGGLIIALYKGKLLHIISHPILTHPSITVFNNAAKHWTRGTMFLLVSCLCFGIWYISQVKLFKIYPHKFWATFYICIIAAVQLGFTGLCINRSKVAWHLTLNLQLITILYSGALATAVSFCLVSWAVAERGPTYSSMFNPLSMMFVAISEALLLGEAISVGSLIGMILIMVGLYLFIWSKNRETSTETKKKTLAVTDAGNEANVPIPNVQDIK